MLIPWRTQRKSRCTNTGLVCTTGVGAKNWSHGHRVMVKNGAGSGAGFSDTRLSGGWRDATPALPISTRRRQ